MWEGPAPVGGTIPWQVVQVVDEQLELARRSKPVSSVLPLKCSLLPASPAPTAPALVPFDSIQPVRCNNKSVGPLSCF